MLFSTLQKIKPIKKLKSIFLKVNDTANNICVEEQLCLNIEKMSKLNYFKS